MPSSHWVDVKRRFDISEVKVATWRDPSLSIHPSRGRPGVMRTISAADAAEPYVPTYKYKIELPKPPEPTDDEMSDAERHYPKHKVDHEPAAADLSEASIDCTDIVSLLAADTAAEMSTELDTVDVFEGTAPGADAEAMTKSAASESEHIASAEEHIERISEHRFADAASDSEVQVQVVPSVEPTIDNEVFQDTMDSALETVTSSDSVPDIMEGDLGHENIHGLPPDHLDPITEAMLQRLLDEPPPSSVDLTGNVDLEALLAGTAPPVLATDIMKDIDIGETSETSDKRVSFAAGTPEPKPTVRKKKASSSSKSKKRKKVTAAQIEELPDDIVAILDEYIEPVALAPPDPAALEAAMIEPPDDVLVHVVDVGESKLAVLDRSSEGSMVDTAPNAGLSGLDPTRQSVDDILKGLIVPPTALLPPSTEVESPLKTKSKSSKVKTSSSKSKTNEGNPSKSKHKTEVPVHQEVAGLGIDMTFDVTVPLIATAAVFEGHDDQDDTLPNLTDKELEDILGHAHDMRSNAATIIEPGTALESTSDAAEPEVLSDRDDFDSQVDNGIPELQRNLQPPLVVECEAIENEESQHVDIEGTVAITREEAIDVVATEKDEHCEVSSEIPVAFPIDLGSCIDAPDGDDTAPDNLGAPLIAEQDAQSASGDSILPGDIEVEDMVSSTTMADLDADLMIWTPPDLLTSKPDGVLASETPAERIDDFDFDLDEIGVDIAGEGMGEGNVISQGVTISALDNDMLTDARELSPVPEPLPDSEVADIDIVDDSELQELFTQGEVDRDSENTFADGEVPSAMTADISALDDFIDDLDAGLLKDIDLVPTDLPKGSVDDMRTLAEDADAAAEAHDTLDEHIPITIDSRTLATKLDLKPLTSVPEALSADPLQEPKIVEEGSARVTEEALLLAEEVSPVLGSAAAAAVAAITAIVADAPPSPTLSRGSKRRSDGWSRPVKKPGDSVAPRKSDTGKASKRSSRTVKSGGDTQASSRRYAVSAEEDEERRKRRRARKEEEAARAKEEQLRREEEDEERRLRHDARRAARKAAMKEAEEVARRIAREEAEAEAKREAESRRRKRERRDNVVERSRGDKPLREDPKGKSRPTLLKAFSVTSGSSRTNAGLLVRTSSDAPRSPTLRRSATDSNAPQSIRDGDASRPTSKRTSTRGHQREDKVDDTPVTQIEDVAPPASPESPKSHRSHRSRDEDGDRKFERPHRSRRDSERRGRRPTLDSQTKKPSFLGSLMRAFS
ncbi:hypothetical protein B0A48_16834 [Cryoendolithus antarcticus]|uniref:Uncharacterized protein n=1 Tax=Cryoendolithus antarcticus TaxID=1507870 RepID=A0A1V8SDL7_9PEZI|nr:hypothetical protein B0A48_16834 [Cryoendolithus antarcticus]